MQDVSLFSIGEQSKSEKKYPDPVSLGYQAASVINFLSDALGYDRDKTGLELTPHGAEGLTYLLDTYAAEMRTALDFATENCLLHKQ